MITKYHNVPLRELELEALNTNNELALAVLDALDKPVSKRVEKDSKFIRPKYKGDAE